MKAPIIGADGNVFNLIGICQKALKTNGYEDMAKELTDRVKNSHSYDEALQIMFEYVEPISDYELENDIDENINI